MEDKKGKNEENICDIHIYVTEEKYSIIIFFCRPIHCFRCF